MVIKKLRKYLDENSVKYIVISHSASFSAQEIAALTHIPGREMAKPVMVNVKGELAMAVLPASYHIDFNRLALAMGTFDVYLALESEFKEKFSDCEVGAMPPFGNLYGIDVYVAQSLTEDEEIAFNAGSHTDLVKMAYKDFERLVQPKILSFTDRLDKKPLKNRVFA